MADQNETTITLRIDGTVYPLDIAELEFGDYVAVKRMTEGECFNLETLALALQREDYPAMAAIAFVAMRKANPLTTEAYALSLKVDQIDVADPMRSDASPAAADELEPGESVPPASRETDVISGGPSMPAYTGSARGSSSG